MTRSPRWTTHGRLKVTGRGEAYVSVWFASRVGRVTVTSPFETKLDPEGLRRGAAATTRSTRRTSPSWPRCGSRRRPMPATPRSSAAPTSTPPARCRPSEQVEAFLERSRPGQSRAKLVDRLLESPEFVDYWAYKWSDLLLVSSRKLPAPSMWSFYRFVRRERGAERAVGPVRPLDRDGPGEHALQRRGQLSTCCTATRSS